MTENQSNPLSDARYGVGFTAGLGAFDTAGWAPPPAGEYAALEDGGRRRDYGPTGCVGIIVAPVLLLAVIVVLLLTGCGPESGGEVGSGIDWTPSTTPVQEPTPTELGGGR